MAFDLDLDLHHGGVVISRDSIKLAECLPPEYKHVLEDALNGADYVEPVATVGLAPLTRPRFLPSIEVSVLDEPSNDDTGSQSQARATSGHPNFLNTNLYLGWTGYRRVTVAQLRKEFNIVKASWEESVGYPALVAQMLAWKAEGTKIKRILALGVGSFHEKEPKTEPVEPAKFRNCHMVQLASILTIAECLGDNGALLPIMAQDPSYSQLEQHHFLPSLGITVVEDPEAFLHIDSHTLVFHVNGYYEILYWISVGTWPAAMIDTDWNPIGELHSAHLPMVCRASVRSMLRHYEKAPILKTDAYFCYLEWARVCIRYPHNTEYSPDTSIAPNRARPIYQDVADSIEEDLRRRPGGLDSTELQALDECRSFLPGI